MVQLLNRPQSMSWQDDPSGLLHHLFWNESLSDPEEGIYRIYGVVHLFSSSGIHVYAFLQTVDSIFYPFVRAFNLDVRLTKRIALVLALGLLLWAWWLQDFRPGFARPLVTFLIRRSGQAWGAKLRIFAPLLITLFFDVVLGWGGGKLHYYLAIAGGLIAMESMQKPIRSNWVRTHLGLALGSWLFTAPIDLWVHHRVSWMTPVFSVITLPVVAQVLYPLSLLSLFFTHTLVLPLIDAWCILQDAILSIADHLPGPLVVHNAGIGIALALAVFAVLSERRAARTPFVIGMMAIGLRPFLPSTTILSQLNVKQGDALLIKSLNRTEMIDVGPRPGMKSSEWIDELFFYDLTRIDTVLFTHLDADHVLGITRLLPWARVDCLTTNSNYWNSEKGQKLIHRVLAIQNDLKVESQNERSESGTGCFRSGPVTWIQSSDPKGGRGNELMAGVAIPLSEDKIYLALGDGDQSQERAFEAQYHALYTHYPHRIWKLGHHGSKNSTDVSVLEKLRPERIWLSVGRKNPYHHPNPLTLWSLTQLEHEFKFQLERTDISGDLTENISQPSRFKILEN